MDIRVCFSVKAVNVYFTFKKLCSSSQQIHSTLSVLLKTFPEMIEMVAKHEGRVSLNLPRDCFLYSEVVCVIDVAERTCIISHHGKVVYQGPVDEVDSQCLSVIFQV